MEGVVQAALKGDLTEIEINERNTTAPLAKSVSAPKQTREEDEYLMGMKNE